MALRIKVTICLFFFLYTSEAFSLQKTPVHAKKSDTALIRWIYTTKSTDSIRNLIYEEMGEDALLAIDYAHAFLNKAKKNDYNMQYLAYYDIGVAYYQNSEYLKAINYVDSSLVVVPEGASKKTRMLSSYLLKGSAYTDNRQYKKALDAFTTGEKLINPDDKLIQYRISFLNNIGIIRIEIKEFQEALITFKELYELMETQKGSESFVIEDYASVILHLALSYYETGDIANAIKYNDIGLELSRNHNLKENEGIFLMNIGEVLIKKEEPDVALEKLYMSREILDSKNSNVNFLLANYYIAKALYVKNEYSKSHDILLENFELIKEKEKNEIKNILEMYDLAYLCAEKLGDHTKQLEYSNAYRAIQKVLYQDDTDTRREIYKENIEKLRNKNQVLSLKNSKNKKNLIFLITFLVPIMILTLYKIITYRKKLKTSKILFNELQEKINDNDFKTKKSNTKSSTVLTDEKAHILLNKLSELENKLFYIQMDCNLYNTAKLLNTNTVYLSKVLNQHKGKSFIEYLNGLRINYFLEVLKTDSRFMSYTIKGIGEELGYKSINTFVKAFKNQTGLTPSYYLKQIRKNM
ncbi:AraC family transcriptional regulator [Aquimarina litoralis]|uniref:AraC family transcriptional regulator n=1 Tax=Aquimarina litoralis TaxID=584605 RepID=UPI001C56E59B|nr:AraC family transcriptional regulator [Aquimarina litoralis]MBW1296009.1 helix-turn-helix domain-containing protein [Aquimarina litoralis]